MLTNYAQLVGKTDDLSGAKLDYKIVDEAQYVKNEEALRTEAVYEIPSKQTLLMSATIMDNKPKDLRLPLLQLWENLTETQRKSKKWQHLASIVPFLRDDEVFYKLIKPSRVKTAERSRQSKLEKLRLVMQEVMIRRRSVDVLGKKLPQKEEEEVELDFETGIMDLGKKKIQLGLPKDYAPQRKLYLKIALNFAIPHLVRKNFLRQVLSDPAMVVREREAKYLDEIKRCVREVEEEYGSIATWRSIKKDAVRKIMEIEEGKRLTLFTRSIDVVEGLTEVGWRGLASSLGGEHYSLRDREETVRAFREQRHSRQALTFGVGGVALDLTSIRPIPEGDLILIESFPNKGSTLRQAIGRHYRRASDNRDRDQEKVKVLKLMTKNIHKGLVSVDRRDKLICEYKDLLALILENGVFVWSVIDKLKSLDKELNRLLFPSELEGTHSSIDQSDWVAESEVAVAL